METSSKTGFNVKRLFCKIGKILYEQTMKDNEVDKVRKNTFNIYNFFIYTKSILLLYILII